MVKHIQTIHRQFADKLFECVWPFCEIGASVKIIRLEVFKLSTTEKRDVSPADRLGFDDRFFDK